MLVGLPAGPDRTLSIIIYATRGIEMGTTKLSSKLMETAPLQLAMAV